MDHHWHRPLRESPLNARTQQPSEQHVQLNNIQGRSACQPAYTRRQRYVKSTNSRAICSFAKISLVSPGKGEYADLFRDFDVIHLEAFPGISRPVIKEDCHVHASAQRKRKRNEKEAPFMTGFHMLMCKFARSSMFHAYM